MHTLGLLQQPRLGPVCSRRKQQRFLGVPRVPPPSTRIIAHASAPDYEENAAPVRSLAQIETQLEQLTDTNALQTALNTALQAEQYKLAARIRDRIKQVTLMALVMHGCVRGSVAC